MATPDFKKLASQLTRDQFAAEWPYQFLAGLQVLARPRTQHRTVDFAAVVGQKHLLETEAAAPIERPSPMVFVIRKVSPAFPQMITVGRTANNDLILTDFQVSKFHAFFREISDGLLLADAGSRNGTFVNDEPLVSKGKPVPVAVGAKVAFGKLRFTLLDCKRCWEFLRRDVAEG